MQVISPEQEASARDFLRGNWRFASIAQFFHAFRDTLRLADMTTGALEGALIRPGDTRLMGKVMWKLLYNKPEETTSLLQLMRQDFNSWRLRLRDKLRAMGVSESLGMEGRVYEDLSLEQRLEVLYLLCVWKSRANCNLHDRITTVKDDDGMREIRPEPCGEDDNDRMYWCLTAEGFLFYEDPAASSPNGNASPSSSSADADSDVVVNRPRTRARSQRAPSSPSSSSSSSSSPASSPPSSPPSSPTSVYSRLAPRTLSDKPNTTFGTASTTLQELKTLTAKLDEEHETAESEELVEFLKEHLEVLEENHAALVKQEQRRRRLEAMPRKRSARLRRKLVEEQQRLEEEEERREMQEREALQAELERMRRAAENEAERRKREEAEAAERAKREAEEAALAAEREREERRLRAERRRERMERQRMAREEREQQKQVVKKALRASRLARRKGLPQEKLPAEILAEVPSVLVSDGAVDIPLNRVNKVNAASLSSANGPLQPTVHIDYDESGQPKLPLVVSKSVTLVNLGRIVYDRPGFSQTRHIFPAGFVTHRIYASLLDASRRCVYVSEILDEGGDQPVFRVTCTEKPDTHFVAHSASAAWSKVERALNEVRVRKRGSFSVSGTEKFGLTDPNVRYLIRRLPNAELVGHVGAAPLAPPQSNGGGQHDHPPTKLVLKRSMLQQSQGHHQQHHQHQHQHQQEHHHHQQEHHQQHHHQHLQQHQLQPQHHHQQHHQPPPPPAQPQHHVFLQPQFGQIPSYPLPQGYHQQGIKRAREDPPVASAGPDYKRSKPDNPPMSAAELAAAAAGFPEPPTQP